MRFGREATSFCTGQSLTRRGTGWIVTVKILRDGLA